MLPLKEKDKAIVGKLLASGCCARCVLRFCCIGVPDAYRHGRRETLRQLRAFAEENHDCQNVGQLEPARKRSRLESEEAADEDEGVCVVCLGVLQHLSDASQAVQIADAVKKEKYEVDTLVLSISLPAQVCVRERSCWLPPCHFDQRSPRLARAKCGALGRRDVVQVKEAFKWIVQGPLARELGAVAVAAKSPLEVSVCFAHPETDADCHFLASTCPDCFKVSKNKQSAFTRMAVAKALEKIPDDKFLERSPRPPSRPSSGCAPPEVRCVHASVLAAFGARGFNFSSSGREDVDVRTLGNGRPFALELLNPRKSQLSPESMKNVQQVINASSEKVRVRDLQMVGRDAASRMKEGEEEKTKSYRALVWTQKSIREDDVAFVNRIEDLRVDQKTPLRVLHRRALAVRQRLVHSMSADLLDEHHFRLGLRTQAGTYIKEFVHGDFGRTKPNLCQLLDTHADILELDVESVDVDWPPALPD
uniref:tRNA pseudouridine(55) synthase n=1 Tax=Hippocampus comes TaxID=109280 RepID=A0A3Q2Y4D9_HIPCM